HDEESRLPVCRGRQGGQTMSRIEIAALSLVSALAGCRATALESASDASATARATASDQPGVAPRSDRSIYALRMGLTDQDGRTVGLDVFRGQPVFLGMFYGSAARARPPRRLPTSRGRSRLA